MRLPRAPEQAEVQHEDRVCAFKAGRQHVVRPQVAVHDPANLAGEATLHGDPLARRERLEPWLPEVLVECDGWESGKGTESVSERRLSRSASPEHNHTFHMGSVHGPRPRQPASPHGNGTSGTSNPEQKRRAATAESRYCRAAG